MNSKINSEKFDREYFDRFYKRPETRASGPEEFARLSRFVLSYLEYLEIPPREVLDLGCGLGRWKQALQQYDSRIRYTGVDVSPYLCGKFGWTQASVTNFTSRQKYDLVICQDVLPYLSKRQIRDGLANITRLCRGAAYLQVIAKEDWDEDNCDLDRTDNTMNRIDAAWYRKAISRHFTNCGGGVFLPKDTDVVLWKLEAVLKYRMGQFPMNYFRGGTSNRRFRTLLGLALVAFVSIALTVPHAATQVSDTEQRMADYAEAHIDEALELLARTVNINSGTLNPVGVQAVADLLAPEFEALGFETRWEPLPAELERAGHLVAEREGNRGRRMLLIGHLDTVFEEDSPFQRFERMANTIKGPGVADMKGGNVVLLYALKSLADVGALDDTTIRVILTGEEERPGLPLSVAKAALIDLGSKSDVALGFESGAEDTAGDLAVVARRGAANWSLEVGGTPSHSSRVFSDEVGAGAVYEAARILNTFYTELRDVQYLTFNVGVILGGTAVDYDSDSSTGTAGGKTNVVPERLVLEGDIRTISAEQLAESQERMRTIVEDHLPQTSATIAFNPGYPAMSPTDQNYELLSVYSTVSTDLGYGTVRPFDPTERGAADISFVARDVDAAMDGLGPKGAGEHTVEEMLEISSLVPAIQRAAILIYRLTR